MSKIKDFLKSPLGTALCAAAACLLAVVLVWWFSVQGVSKTNTGIFNVSAAPIKSLRQRLF